MRLKSITLTTTAASSEPEPEYTADFVTPNGVSVDSITGSTITMPECTVPTGNLAKEYSFAGWAKTTVNNTTTKPTLYKAGESVKLDANTEFYAVYTYSEITEGSGSSDTFEKYSGTITEGNYIIVYNNYAMSASISSNRFANATISASNNKITSPDESIVWYITTDDTNWYLYNESVSKYAASTGTKNQGKLVSAIEEKAKWTVTGTSNYEFVNVSNKNSGINANLRNNGSYGFACYATGTGGALTLYKQASGASEVTYYTTSLETSDCDHSSATVNRVEATCETAGSITTTCSCGYEKVETIEALGHDYVGVETTAPSCTSTGIKTYTCNNDASHTYTEDIPKISHNYVDGECTECGAEKPTGFVLVEDASQLKPGAQIIIVATSADYAMGTPGSNNIAQIAFTKDGNEILPTEGLLVITLEVGAVENTFAFKTDEGYLYSASSSSNYLRTKATLDDNGSWIITIENGVATIKSQGDYTHNWIRYNKNNNPPIFSAYASGQTDVAIYMLDICVHEWGEGEVTTTPTCLTTGEKTYTCASCGETKTEELPVTNTHAYENNTCTDCGTVMVGRFYVGTKRGDYFFWMTNGTIGGQYIAASDSELTALPYEILSDDANSDYVFVIEKLGDVYYIYAEGIDADEKYLGWTSGNTAIFVKRTDAVALTMTGVTEHTSQFCFNDGEQTRYLSLINNSTYNYIAFYSGTQLQNLSFIPVVDEETPIPQNPIKSVNVKLGTDLAMLYNVLIPHGEPTKMTFEFGGKNYEITDFTYTGYGIYQFEFSGIGPHQMATEINASLYVGESVVDTHENYSINDNLDNISDGASDSILAIIKAVSDYGVKANAYTTGNADTTVDLSGIEINASLHAPTTNDATLAYFKSAGVYFDVTNKIYVKFYAIEGFSITIKKGSKVLGTYNAETCESLGDNMYKLYTGDITPIEFNDSFTFSISVGGEEVATLAYSVNGYALAMQGSGIPQYVADLAKALYAYGVAVENYKA